MDTSTSGKNLTEKKSSFKEPSATQIETRAVSKVQIKETVRVSGTFSYGDLRKRSMYSVNPEYAHTHLDFLFSMATTSVAQHKRQTKILATLGPACKSVEMIEEMIKNGMDIARIAMYKFKHEYHKEYLQNLRTAVSSYSEKLGRVYPVALAIDIKGPQIYTGVLEPEYENMEINQGAVIRITSDKTLIENSTDQVIYVDCESVGKVIPEGSLIYMNHGLIIMTAKKNYPQMIDCVVKSGGKIRSYMRINVPGLRIDLPNVSEKDRDDLRFAVDEGADVIINSLTRNANAIHQVKKTIIELGGSMTVIAKIENQEGLDHFEEILDAADGILIDRLDIGIEISNEKVFLAQKYIIAMCNLQNKSVFIASQILYSMLNNPMPTRSEASDVANAVLDGVDVLCLYSESAIGKYPVKCIGILADISKEVEACIWRKQVFKDICNKLLPPLDAEMAIAMCAVQASFKVEAAAILVVSHSGKSAKTVAKFKPRCPILTVTRVLSTCMKLCCYKAVVPYWVNLESDATFNWTLNMDERVQAGLRIAQNEGIIQVGQAVVVITGWKQGLAFTNTMRIVYLPSIPQSILY